MQSDSGPTSILSPDDPEVSRARMPLTSDPIVALRNTRTGEELAIDDSVRRWVLGKRRSCDLYVHDPFVSNAHCTIERRMPGGPLTLRDRTSRNGTFVNGVSIEAAVLRPGSVILVGKTTLVAVAEQTRRTRTVFEQLRGSHPAFRAEIGHALRAAATECNILIVGETGTGKDLVARLVHDMSGRAAGPYVAVNCGAIPRELIGSELFGHERGAFTGAVVERDGLFVQANTGTLFLDEIGELPIEQQPHLLRALENRRVRRIGGVAERPTDARIIAATNRVEGLGTPSSRLRLDLFHRLATVIIALPPLRERGGDIRDLVVGMMADLAPQYGQREVSAAAWTALAAYHWPGNVRELQHAVSRAMALGGELLGPADFLPDHVLARAHRFAAGTPLPFAAATAAAVAASGSLAAVSIGARVTTAAPALASYAVALPSGPDAAGLPAYAQLLRDAMVDALARHKSIRRAARYLGMPKSTFADKARAWGLLDDRLK
jgi:DNA-binding NtrC family response regulator